MYLMYAGAALGIISMILSFVLIDQVRQQVEDQLGASGTPVDSSVVDAAVTTGIVLGVVFGLIGAGLWIMNAIFCGKGKNWARILSTVLAGLFVLSSLFTFFQPGSAIAKVITFLSILVAIGAVVLLWQRDSNQFFAAHSGR